MKSILFLLTTSLLFAKDIEIISYDWVGHFGYVNYNGSLMWNKDWKSGPYFFDGTWSNNPGLMGPEIKDGFLNRFQDTIHFDTSKVTSYFEYVQGDYLQDEFSTAADYNGDGRHIRIHGFKRSYAGKYSQYVPSGMLPRPIHQTYAVQYKSEKEFEKINAAIGHFNTYSGLPDTVNKALYNSRITSNNLYWEKPFGDFTPNISANHFLQMLKSDFSYTDSLGGFSESFKQARYLTRSKYSGKLKWYKDKQMNLFLKFELNNRGVRLDKLRNEQWKNYLIGIEYENFSVSGGLVSVADESKFLWDFYFNLSRNNYTLRIYHNQIPKPAHPYFKRPGILTSSYLTGAFGKIIMGRWNLSVSANQVKYLSNFSQSNPDSILNYYPVDDENLSIGVALDFQLIRFMKIMLKYIHQDGNSLISDGVEQRLKIAGLGSFSLFNGIMKIGTNIEFHKWFNRKQRGFLLPVEAIPVPHDYSNLNDIWFVNAKINAHVSSITISYTWHNLSEIILDASGYNIKNDLVIHPLMPEMGRQASMIISWDFLD